MLNRSIAILLFIGCYSHFANAQNFNPIDSKSSIKINIKNVGLNVAAAFSGLQGVIIFNPDSVTKSYFKVSISSSSINSGIGLRDKHLRKEEYLDVTNYPEIKFESTNVTWVSANTYKVMGLLTIKKVSKEIGFNFKAISNNSGYIFSGDFKINRRDYNVGSNSFTLNDTAHVTLRVVAEKSKDF